MEVGDDGLIGRWPGQSTASHTKADHGQWLHSVASRLRCGWILIWFKWFVNNNK